MLGAAILGIGLAAVGAGDYLRPFASKGFDQATLDAEGFGGKKAMVREDDGLRVTLAQGEAEAGWKTPTTLRIGGDCTITAKLVIRKLPKPAGEDGAAIGLAVATQSVDQPDATLLRQVEPDGKDVYRSVNKAGGMGGPQPMMMGRGRPFVFNPFNNQIADKPVKPPRLTFPAKGSAIRLEVRREGSNLHYQVFDEMAPTVREVGQLAIGPGDIAGVKLFISNRNGPEPVDVLFQDLTIHADRISGLGTATRTIFGTVVHGDPSGLDAEILTVGGPPPPPPAPAPGPNPAAPPTAKPNPEPPKPGDAVATKMAVAAPAAPAAPTAPAPAATVTVTVSDGAVSPAPARVRRAGPGPAQGPVQPPPPAPKVRVPLDEVETITFERASMLSARYLGQPNVDTTMPGGSAAKDSKDGKDSKDNKDSKDTKDAKDAKDAKKPPTGDDLSAPPPGTVAIPKILKVDPKPNGIRDIHLSLSSLREAAITQVMIQCPTDKGQASWQLDTTGSENWPLTLARAGTESWADLFLEPPDGDCNDKQFTINITYADGQPGNTTVKAAGHTDPKLAFDPESPTPALNARIFLAGDEQIFGKLEAITEEALTLTTPWGDRVDLPMARIIGVYMGMPDHKETAESFAKRLKDRGGKDTLLAKAKDGEVVVITGVVEGAKANKLQFVYQDKTRTLPLKLVEGLVLAARPAPKPPAEVRPTFSLAGGVVVSGRWKAIDPTTWQVETPWGQMLKLPALDVRSVRVRGGQMTFLSDLEPTQVEEIPYFARRSPYRRDLNLSGGPLKLDGQAIDKGLAVHSRTALTYDLDRRYTVFEALVGFDEAGKKRGRVDCRVFADGKELYGNPDLRADAPPVPLKLPVAGAEQLKLVIDFGPDEDTGDRVIWANARLYRRSEAKPLPPEPTPAPTPTPVATPAPGATTPAPAATPAPAPASTPAPAPAPAPAPPPAPATPTPPPPPASGQ